MKIAHVAPIYSPVPPTGYGGVERVVNELLLAQLAFNNLELLLYAPSDSTVPLALRSILPSVRSLKDTLSEEELVDWERTYFEFVCRTCSDIDVLHAHGTWIIPYAHLTGKAVVVSVYTDTSLPQVQETLSKAPGNVFLIANSQRTRDKFATAKWLGTVLEGLCLELYPFEEKKDQDQLVFVGELTPHKGCHLAIQVARELGYKLTIIGRSAVLDVPEDILRKQQDYVTTEIEPYLDERICYLGEMGEERLDHIKHACAVLCPISWEEPFGRIMAESMACGTPVIAMRSGAVPEVVLNEVTGFIVESIEEMKEAVRRVKHISPADCREHVRVSLNMQRVAKEYVQIYHEILEKVTLIS
ncbi:glycosyltransferase [Paenibacillus sp. Y412MC10]|uniref:glycosyltransferase n=1 Tax=Geobacillus sp. (strain Y412MC10) TaxID=481743 RepID=UPI0016432F1F|nr:glycosyltransferase [Paenibacillus sp. Y412MC10]